MRRAVPDGPTSRGPRRRPRRRLPWRWPTLLTLTASPALAGILAAPDDPARTALTLAGLTCLLVAVAAGTLLFAMRMATGERGYEWIAAILVVLGLSDLPFGIAFLIGGAPDGGFSSGELTEVVAITMMLVMLQAARRASVLPLGIPPILVGVVVALGIVALRAISTRVGAHGWLDPALFRSSQVVVLAVLGVGLVITVGRLSFLTPSARQRFQVVTVGLGLGHALDTGQFAGAWADVAGGALRLVFITLLLATTAQLLRSAVAGDRRRLMDMDDQAWEAERALAHDTEIRHELRSALGGIRSASELLRVRSDDLTVQQRERLADAVCSELARLGRLTNDTPPEAETHQLDELVEAVVAVHATHGSEVTCDVGPERVRTNRDHLSEVLITLLHNAQRHAPGRRVTISTGHRRGFLELRVHDDGPGIHPALQQRLFRRGAAGPRSPGSGLGLHMAQRLMEEMGGLLLLEDDTCGTTFVVLIPTVRELAG